MLKWCSLLALALTSCSENPAWYPLPPQRESIQNAPPAFIQMNDPAADKRIVSDVRGLEGTWRWSGKRPTFRFPASTVEPARAVVEFAIAGETFKTTGPLTLTFLVNGTAVDSVRYAKPGNYRFEKPVTLSTAEPNTLAIDIDKVWTSPTDGTQLGIILSAAGFLP